MSKESHIRAVKDIETTRSYMLQAIRVDIIMQVLAVEWNTSRTDVESMIYRLAAAKKIPGFKGGGAWRFQRRSINGYASSLEMMRLPTLGRRK